MLPAEGYHILQSLIREKSKYTVRLLCESHCRCRVNCAVAMAVLGAQEC